MGVLRHRPRSWQDCVVWALGHWQLCFGYGIAQLLRRHPPDKVGAGGPEAAGAEGPPEPSSLPLLRCLRMERVSGRVPGSVLSPWSSMPVK